MPQDLSQVVRSLMRTPVFAVVAIATLALGVGLNTALFGIVNVMLFKPLPVDAGEDLVWISSASSKPDGPRGNMTHPDVVDLAAAGVLAGATAYGHLPANVAIGDRAARLSGEIVMGNFFEVVGVRAHRGRLLTPADDDPAASRAAVIAFSLWQQVFGRRDSAIGEELRINGHVFTVVGVAPAGFRGADVFEGADLWVPMAAAGDVLPGMRGPLSRTSWWLKAVGRLAPGQSLESASVALRTRAVGIAEAFPASHDGFTVRVDPVRGVPPRDREEIRPLSALLLGVTMAVLLIACANVANLLLVRGVSQARETAIRVALGASRMRLVRQRLIESVLLAALGGSGGLVLSLWATELLVQFAGAPLAADFTPDWRVAIFALGVSALTAVLFGLAPALRGAAVPPASALKSERGSAGARPRTRLQGTLVAGQLALSLVLLVAAALFLKSLLLAPGLDVGFNPRGRVALALNLSMYGYTPERAQTFYASLLERVRANPSVRAASLAEFIPLGGRVGIGRITLPGAAEDAGGRRMNAAINSVWPRFFETMEIPIVRGRALNDRDMIGERATAVVNETLAARHWPGRDPIGERFSVDGAQGPFLEVVGVARDTIVDEFTEDPMAAVFVPGRATTDDVAFIAWIDGDAAAGLRGVEADIRALDSRVATFEPRTLEQHLADRLDGERGLTRLLGLFGALAVTLAAIGLYGVMAYTVARRTREIGVRMALGAAPEAVVRFVVRDAARLVIAGLVAGILPAIGVTALLSGSVVGARVADPIALGSMIAVLAGITLLAAYLPARRATRIDPVAALRAE